MADEAQLNILRQGVASWNHWRHHNPSVQINLSRADLREANLNGADLSWAKLTEAYLRGALLCSATLTGAKLSKANLSEAKLTEAKLKGADLRWVDFDGADLTGAILSRAKLRAASLRGTYLTRADLYGADFRRADLFKAELGEINLSGADLRRASLNEANLSRARASQTCLGGADLRRTNLFRANLSKANLRKADLRGANLSAVDLSQADLRWADLSGANLSNATLEATNFRRATLRGARIYGVSVWNVKLEGAKQQDLIITEDNEPEITVDNLEVAQFIYLLIHNDKIRHVIDTITSKVVLILGRFTDERKAVLDAIREQLRHLNYVPVLFDFPEPENRDFTETVKTLAHMARFIIPDLTEAKSVPQELQAIVPTLAIPVLPIVHEDHGPWGMWKDFYKYMWVLKEHRYGAVDQLLKDLENTLIPRALDKIPEIERLRRRDGEV